MQRLLDRAVNDIYSKMSGKDSVCQDDAEEYSYNKSSNNPEYLVKDFCSNFKAHVKGKSNVHFDIRPTIAEDGLYNLLAKYRVW